MKWILLPFCIAYLAFAGGLDAQEQPGPQASVVRVRSSLRFPNPVRPWTKQRPVTLTGSGTIISGNRILTNSHLVQFAELTEIQDRAGGPWYEARVEHVGREIDLAIITLEDPSFFDDHPPIPMAPERPRPMSPLMVYGFPVGGDDISVTQGIISRVGVFEYGSGTEAMALQVDAAINPGNSGGPALVADQMVGVVVSRLNEAENVGFVIPNEEIQHFLNDIADGEYSGRPGLNFSGQVVQNPALRERFGLPPGTSGILVIRLLGPSVESGGEMSETTDANQLQELDVITAVNGVPLDSEGMVRLDDGIRVPFDYPIALLTEADTVDVTLIRDSTERTIELPLSRSTPTLMPSYDGTYPPFFICGPLVFSPVRSDALTVYLANQPLLYALGSPMVDRDNSLLRFPDEELVVVTAPLLPHRTTRGYGEPFGQVVDSINGITIRNLPHLVEVLRDSRDEFLTIRFAESGYPSVMVFRRQEMMEATTEVMLENGIPAQGSAEIMEIWNNTLEGER